MTHKLLQKIALGATLSLTSLYAAATELTPLWQVDGFKMPESVVFDASHDRYYVSNVNQGPLEADNNGSIGFIQADGSVSTVEWVKGFHSPKGLDLQGNKLFVADIKELAVVNVDTGKVSARYPAPDSQVLNGIDVSKRGVFVSDWIGNAIYKLDNHELKLWYKSDALENPNGLFVKGQYLYIGSWGTNIRADFTTETSGSLKRIHLKTKQLETLTAAHDWMNLDGLHAAPKGRWYATDFITGELLVINRKGTVEERIELGGSSADFFYNKRHDVIVVPFLMGDKVVAYKVEQ